MSKFPVFWFVNTPWNIYGIIGQWETGSNYCGKYLLRGVQWNMLNQFQMQKQSLMLTLHSRNFTKHYGCVHAWVSQGHVWHHKL